MPSYQRLGEVPAKRHTQLRSPSGELYAEEVIGTEGFSGRYSILYHCGLPAQVRCIERGRAVAPRRWEPDEHRNRHLRTAGLARGGDPISGRVPLLFNEDLVISVAVVGEPSRSFYKNLTRDELLFVHEGDGVLATQFGELPVRAGDYVYVPRGTTQQLRLDGDQGRLLVVEASGAIEIPHRYRNLAGQLTEQAPYWERDFRAPERLVTHQEIGEGAFEVQVKIDDEIWCHHLDHHPFDVVGWDGYLYPFAFSIHDFEPIAGRIHVPPTVHQTFEGPQFVVCSFVPRPLDWDPLAVPIPYYHANVDSDEVLYYVSGEYAARKVEQGSLTVHPRGMPHGPSAGAVEATLQRPRQTDEYAVMIDTFRPLHLTEVCAALDDPAYLRSWDRP